MAQNNGNQELQPEHLLKAILEQPDGVVVPVLQKMGVTPSVILNETNQLINNLPKVSGTGANQTYASQALRITSYNVCYTKLLRLHLNRSQLTGLHKALSSLLEERKIEKEGRRYVATSSSKPLRATVELTSKGLGFAVLESYNFV